MKFPKSITVEELMQVDYRYNYSEEELLEDWRRLQTITEYKSGAQFKPGMKVCQHFFDNFWNIKNSQGKSFADCWNDPVVMTRVLEWGREGMSQLWLSWIRRAVFMAGGLPNSSFYRPHFSKLAIKKSNILCGTLYDPCAGWGGRMLGTVAAGWKYVACEPNPETYQKLLEVAEFLNITEFVDIHCMPAEDFDLGSLETRPDVILTSPPYYNLENYTDHPDQSYNRHSNFEDWKNHWYLPLIRDCLDNINPDGLSAWNVMDINQCNLVDPMIELHQECGWELVDTLGFHSPLNYIRKLKNKDVTYLFVKTGK